MFKSMFKELAIIILLLIAIGLVFVIIFYDYNTINTTIPKQVQAYELQSDIREELEETLKAKETQELVKTYILDENDLRTYEAKNTYEKGKPNPFSQYEESEPEGTDNSSGTSTSGNSTTENNTTSGGDSGKLTDPTKGK